jgi:hypothetical protein
MEPASIEGGATFVATPSAAIRVVPSGVPMIAFVSFELFSSSVCAAKRLSAALESGLAPLHPAHAPTAIERPMIDGSPVTSVRVRSVRLSFAGLIESSYEEKARSEPWVGLDVEHWCSRFLPPSESRSANL